MQPTNSPSKIVFPQASHASQPLQPSSRLTAEADTKKNTPEESRAHARALLAIKSLRPESLRKQLTERRSSLDSLLNSEHCPISAAMRIGSWRSLNVIAETAGSGAGKPARFAKVNNPRHSTGTATLHRYQSKATVAEPVDTPKTENTVAAKEQNWCNAVFDAIRNNQAELLKKKLTGQADALERLTQNGNSPLTVATSLPLKWKALMVLIEHLPGLCDVNKPFEELQLQNRFLLHEAAYRGDLPALEVLFKNGAKPDVRLDGESPTALHLAAGKLHVGIVNSLLKKGADFTLRTSDRSTPILHAVRAEVKRKESLKRTVTALMDAIAKHLIYQLDTKPVLQTLGQTLAKAQKNTATAEAIYEEHNQTPLAVTRSEREAHQKHLETLRLAVREMKETEIILKRYTKMTPNPMHGRW
ncbi:MAG: ankyrin repeat domain-containing protein [Burkholderiales bacterium]|nr:ankyrin repeat domain-containing protein [Burkholderiales bacterium]